MCCYLILSQIHAWVLLNEDFYHFHRALVLCPDRLHGEHCIRGEPGKQVRIHLCAHTLKQRVRTHTQTTVGVWLAVVDAVRSRSRLLDECCLQHGQESQRWAMRWARAYGKFRLTQA